MFNIYIYQINSNQILKKYKDIAFSLVTFEQIRYWKVVSIGGECCRHRYLWHWRFENEKYATSELKVHKERHIYLYISFISDAMQEWWYVAAREEKERRG